MKKPTRKQAKSPPGVADYTVLIGNIGELLETARRSSARAVNAAMTATCWEIGRRIVEFEQGGEKRAEYEEELLTNLAHDLTGRFGRGFPRHNLGRFRQLYLTFDPLRIRSTTSIKSSDPGKRATLSLKSADSSMSQEGTAIADIAGLARAFPLPWSHHVLLVSNSRSPEALEFYHTEALRGGWTVRQLRRQMDSQFYERTALSRNKVVMLEKGAKFQPEDQVTADKEIKDPLVLEFPGLKLGKFAHADTGQMHLYLNYATEHWAQPGENPPVGMIPCSGKGNPLVRYPTENLPNKLLVRDYLTTLPDERTLAAEIASARKKLEARTP